ncbi:MAG: hypothetical protein IJ587_10270 [Synergistaceae bacterium]|nr:hypothetical protein [Synergistaceae bacterium]
MNYSLGSDFQAFIDSRLDCVGHRLKNNADYKRKNDNIENATQELLAAMSPKMAFTLSDIDDSYLEIITICERASYRQGFKDALRLFSEF